MEDIFWQANFWGIVGTASGALGIIISWLNWRYSKPKIKITELCLEAYNPGWVQSSYNITNKEDLRSHYLSFKLNIVLKNKKGGSGSIEKPILVLIIPKNGQFLFIKISEKVFIKPQTKYYNGSDFSDSGVAWNLKGGETINDELEYDLCGDKDIEKMIRVIKNYKNLQYSIEYSDNFGRKYNSEVKNIIYK